MPRKKSAIISKMTKRKGDFFIVEDFLGGWRIDFCLMQIYNEKCLRPLISCKNNL